MNQGISIRSINSIHIVVDSTIVWLRVMDDLPKYELSTSDFETMTS